MALVQKRLSSQRRTILMIVILLFLAISVYLVVQNLSKGGTSSQPQPGGVDVVDERDLPIHRDLGEAVLGDPRIEKLKSHSAPIKMEGIGRSNPFVEAPAKEGE